MCGPLRTMCLHGKSTCTLYILFLINEKIKSCTTISSLYICTKYTKFNVIHVVLIIHNSDWVKKINKDVTLKTVTFQCIHILKKRQKCVIKQWNGVSSLKLTHICQFQFELEKECIKRDNSICRRRVDAVYASHLFVLNKPI